ncbi:zonular occludens toxin domain-containing protein [Massilia sp. BKSP1R2A-1]|uniref:zonular occludens toxin domain-containing protein n=1 Tax=Massilia sp. BKSP1R2A-1 TaxID=3422595 RepID=UPI003D34B5D0
MPINVYTGLMRSGKSYEVVSEVIVPAIRSGRRVVTNVDGISEEKIHQYLAAKNPQADATKFGRVLHVTNEQVFKEDFFPYYDDAKDAQTDTVVQPGDLVAIDEAWRFWGDGMKVHKNHRSFFLEHGHFTDSATGVACDLVLMIQDMNTLERKLKSVVAFNFRTHKKVSLGLNNTYSLTMWEGYKQAKGNKIGNWVRRYKKDVFPLYSSFKGGGKGVLVNADSRQNIFASKKIWLGLVGMIVALYVCGTNAYKFFNPQSSAGAAKAPAVDHKGAQGPQAGAVAVASPAGPAGRQQAFSEAWRVVGTFHAKGLSWVVVSNQAGVVRLESPSQFAGSGLVQIGDLDGARVTSWSGAVPVARGNTPSPAPAAPVPIGEFVK